MLKSIIITLSLLISSTQQVEMKEFPETGLISNGRIDNAQYYDRASSRYGTEFNSEIVVITTFQK